jgi:O-antigen ligase
MHRFRGEPPSPSIMRFSRDTLPYRLGFYADCPHSRLCFAPALALALAFVLLPICLLSPFDSDRTLPLLFLPAVWLGWKISRPVATAILILSLAVFGALLVSTAFAAHSARALVSVSAVAWVIAGGMVARNLAPCLPAVRLVLGGIALGAAIGGGMVLAGVGASYMGFPTYWGARIFSMHQYAGAVAGLGWLALRPASRGASLAALALTAAACVGLASSGSRAPLVGLAFMLACWLWRGSAENRRLLLRTIPVLTGVALLVSWWIGSPYATMGWWSAVSRTANASSLVDVASGRGYFWPVVWHQVWDSPWIGHGADAYQYIQPRLHGAQPHNAALQWLFEYGLAGTIPILLLLALGVTSLARENSSADGPEQTFRVWSAASLAGALAYGLFDGVFYHMVAFMPFAVFAGFALGGSEKCKAPVSPLPWHRVLRPGLLVALLAILLHGWLGLMLLRADKVGPDSPPAKLLRAFPSTTFGLNNWIKQWEQTHPEVVMDWITWAQSASNQQPEYHLAAVNVYLGRRDFISAERELRACLPKVRDIEVPDVERLLVGVSAKAREQASAPVPQSAK